MEMAEELSTWKIVNYCETTLAQLFGAHIPIKIKDGMYTEPKTVGKTIPTKFREKQHAWAEIFFEVRMQDVQSKFSLVFKF